MCVVGGGQKKINLGPGLYSLKFAVNKFCLDIVLPLSRPDKRSKLLIIEG